MKLSQIVAYKNLLDSMTPLETMAVAHDKLAPILHQVQTSGIQHDYLTNKLDQTYRQILSNLDSFDQTIDLVKLELERMIKQLEPPYYVNSHELYKEMTAYDSTEYILNRMMSVDEPGISYITGRIQLYSDWKHAGMIIRPGRENWINHLVGCDPLYLVDQSLELLEPSILRFNDQYQRRLRSYKVQESFDDNILTQLPDNQFGFCLVYNFFNYKPIEIFKQYLTEIYTKLKPGGTLAFTFNDGDQQGAVELAERNFICYTPGREVMKHIESLGFFVKQQFKISSACLWVELQKPGSLTTLRGGQTLAKLVYKDDNYKYTSEEQRNIRHHAADLNINTPNELKQMPIGQIVELIKQRTRN